LNNDSSPSLGEGISDMNVTVEGTTNHTDFSAVVQSDQDGVWRLFVPIREVYNVTVTKEGFETVYYEMGNESGFEVLDSPDSRDVEVDAGFVSVSGTVTDQLDAARLVDANIVLYPAAGIERDIVTLTGTMNGSTLEWSASIQPGEWIVVVTEANPGPNGGGVTIGLLDATVSTGGNLTQVMALGGYVDLSTAWTDIELNDHHAGSSDATGALLVRQTVELEVTYDGMSWMIPVPESGELKQLFPEGSVSFDSEFMTVQHSTALDMEYYGGQTTDVNADSTIAATLQFNRRVNSNVDIVFNSDTLAAGAELVAGTDGEIQAVPTNETADGTIEFNFDVSYNGTEIDDLFTVTGEMALSQDSEFWTVELWNETSKAYEESVQVNLGIGNNETPASLTASVKARLTLPSIEDAWHLENGHRMTLRMETDLGEASQSSIKVFIPQLFDFEISDATEVLGMSALVERQFSFTITNNGNGLDTFTIELQDNGALEGWSITPTMSTLSLNKGETRTQQFTVFAPESFVEGESDIPVTVFVNSLDESVGRETVTVLIQKATIVLSVKEGDIATLSDQISNQDGVVRIPVLNSGSLDAPSVIVYLTPPGMGEMSRTISVGAGETVTAEFDGINLNQGPQRFDLRMEVAGAEANSVESNTHDEVEDFSLEFNPAPAAQADGPLFMLVIVGLVIVILYGGMRVARSRSGAKF